MKAKMKPDQRQVYLWPPGPSGQRPGRRSRLVLHDFGLGLPSLEQIKQLLVKATAQEGVGVGLVLSGFRLTPVCETAL